MKKCILTFFILLTLSSCDITKQATKEKGEANGKDSYENKVFRKGDTVHYSVPKINYRDTVIYRVNRMGTTIATQYDSSGQIRNIDCFASAIEEMTRQNREFFEQFKNKTKDKEEKFDSTIILYIIIGVVILGAIALFLMYKSINKNSAAITTILQKLDLTK